MMEATGDYKTAVHWNLSAQTPRGMVLVPGGHFVMGTNSEKSSEASRPAHLVYVDPFFMDVAPVTNRQFAEFASSGYKTAAERDDSRKTWRTAYEDGKDSKDNKDNHPVVNVSYEDALAYAYALGRRLPTEAEWERAARSGHEGRRFPWGNEEPPGRAVYNKQGTSAVGLFGSNSFGLYDMAGNVWEWCSDWLDENYYKLCAGLGVVENPAGPASGVARARRGGAYNVREAFRMENANRGAMKPDQFWPNLGLRCAKPVDSYMAESFREILRKSTEPMMDDGGGIIVKRFDPVAREIEIAFNGTCLYCPNMEKSAFALAERMRNLTPPAMEGFKIAVGELK